MAETSYTSLISSIITATKTLFPNNPVIVANQNGREPSSPYVVVRVVRDTQIGIAYQDTLLNAQEKARTTANYEIVVQFSFISKDGLIAADLAKYFIQYLNTPATREIFRKNKLSKTSVSSIRNMAVKRESTWIQMYNVDVTFLYAIVTELSNVPLETIQVNDLTGEVVYTVPPDVVIP